MHGYFHGLLLLQLSSVGTHDYVVQGMIRLIDILVISERNGIRGIERRYSLFRRVTSLLLSRGTYACVISALGLWHQCLELQEETLWYPKQLKDSLSLHTLSDCCFGSLSTSKREGSVNSYKMSTVTCF